ncbi:DNA-binding response regulator [Paenibacillus sp. J23TS9]|uniref:response regulator transcription factor n=1 Tax=Paenibacillus sp. J23TS9 TaxID=2807193 RepID=UPI001B2AE2F2|nr:helix-turn-helix domain-containing protein [Paenibacillus sp. J23TS9]GIP27934.1 DNA-binding response regulator [Paenibacillus sp. J23TS9]
MLNVLLVDDEPWVLEGLRTMVAWEKYGFQVCGEALNGSDALRQIQEYHPELVITDIHMPVLNGIELIEKSNQILSKPPKFVVLSGYDDFSYARAAMRQRAAGYLLKPVDDEEMGALLNKLSRKIRDEITAEEDQKKTQFLAVNHVINRLLQGEYNRDLEGQAGETLKLQGEEEIGVALIENVFDYRELRPKLIKHFGIEAGFQDRDGKTGIILQSSILFSEGRFEEAIHGLERELSEMSSQPVIIAVSNKMSGIRSIREMYLQALEVGRMKRRQGRGGVFYFRDLRKTKQRQDLHKDKFKLLYETVQAGKTEDIPFCVKETFTCFMDSLLEIEFVKANVADLELSLCRLIAEMNGKPDALMEELRNTHGNLGGIGEYGVLEKYVCQLCAQAAEGLSELMQQNESNTIFHVIQYVDREYRNKLQLQDLARHFHMNATYLGQLFKKNTGKPFNEYLNERRIEEAKRLLKRTQMKISDVAVRVGYPNTDYFINKFKLKTGVLPSVYKNDAGNKQM